MIVDIAALQQERTYALALGCTTAGLFTNNDDLAIRCLLLRNHAGNVSGSCP